MIDLPRRSISASRLAGLLGDWRSARAKAPLHRALAESLRLLILDGRLPLHMWLPGERDLAGALGVSRTTTAGAYANLRDAGYLRGRPRTAPYTALPAERATPSGAIASEPEEGIIDLAFAAMPAPAGLLHAAMTAALEELPRYLTWSGYELVGLAPLRAAVADAYATRGLPTAPDQIMITSGAQHACTLVLRLLAGPADRVLIDHPTYPNAIQLIAHAGCRPVPVPLAEDGWDVAMLATTMRQSAPRLGYLVPDFHNPTGLLLDESGRAAVADAAAATRTVVIVDETLVDFPLDGREMPLPLAAFDRSGSIISVGSTSKSFWGGLRVGWIRAHRELIDRLAALRPAIDLGTPVVEQLAAVHLLRHGTEALATRRRELAARRDALTDALQAHLPSWRYRRAPGGLSLWCELDGPVSTALAAIADHHGVRLASGPRFGVGGAFDRFVRLPHTLPEPVLNEATRRLAAGYALVLAGAPANREPVALAAV